MSSLKRFRILTPLITLGVLSLFLSQSGHNAIGKPRLEARAYIERGDRVENRYEAYSKRLAKHYAALLGSGQDTREAGGLELGELSRVSAVNISKIRL
jgi:hypothetical protein